ncbi:hypothetical protein TIFTF001_015870 [Ficus carica]|uniref:Uncharacterized protein n=1 Tax=Ficus carica TaxID=3494 RepID=A0AA88A9J8_FICCA|nr:hypothetical protein TIFTF001_015870 [Ficus carica]
MVSKCLRKPSKVLVTFLVLALFASQILFIIAAAKGGGRIGGGGKGGGGGGGGGRSSRGGGGKSWWWWFHGGSLSSTSSKCRSSHDKHSCSSSSRLSPYDHHDPDHVTLCFSCMMLVVFVLFFSDDPYDPPSIKECDNVVEQVGYLSGKSGSLNKEDYISS